MIMIQVRNLNGLQSSWQLFMRGAAGVNIMGQFVNVTAGGDATLTAGVREKERERERELKPFLCTIHSSTREQPLWRNGRALDF